MTNFLARFLTGGVLLALYSVLLKLTFFWYAGSFICMMAYLVMTEWPRLTQQWPGFWRWGVAGLSFAAPFYGWITVYLQYAELSLWLVAYPVLAAVVCDTGAYLVGRFLGRHRVFPVLSPKKTYEGLVAGYLSVLGLNWAYAAIFPGLTGCLYVVSVSPVKFGFVVASCAVLGDLAISFLKRRAGVKDSGTLLPGHGGILDRAGSLFFVFFLVALMCLWTSRI